METPAYNYAIVRSFVTWSIIWGVVAVLVGVLIAFQLVDPELNFSPYLTYGRLRPIHTNAGIFGWGIGSFFALFYYIVQRSADAPVERRAGQIPALAVQCHHHRRGGHPAARLSTPPRNTTSWSGRWTSWW